MLSASSSCRCVRRRARTEETSIWLTIVDPFGREHVPGRRASTSSREVRQARGSPRRDRGFVRRSMGGEVASAHAARARRRPYRVVPSSGSDDACLTRRRSDSGEPDRSSRKSVWRPEQRPSHAAPRAPRLRRTKSTAEGELGARPAPRAEAFVRRCVRRPSAPTRRRRGASRLPSLRGCPCVRRRRRRARRTHRGDRGATTRRRRGTGS